TISSEKSRAVKLSLKSGSVVISATSPENGTAVEELEVKYEGAPLEIGFNSRYLLDVADEIDGDGLQMVLADAVAPTLVRDMADAMALYVLMPARGVRLGRLRAGTTDPGYDDCDRRHAGGRGRFHAPGADAVPQ